MDWSSNRSVVYKGDTEIGSLISFTRREQEIQGKVINIREKSVIAEVSKEAAEILGIENTLTVVNHAKYKLI